MQDEVGRSRKRGRQVHRKCGEWVAGGRHDLTSGYVPSFLVDFELGGSNCSALRKSMRMKCWSLRVASPYEIDGDESSSTHDFTRRKIWSTSTGTWHFCVSMLCGRNQPYITSY